MARSIMTTESAGGTEAATGRIDLQEVDKVFTPRRGSVAIEALRSISLDVRPGEFVSLVGPSGCGKSTLLKMIAGLLEPSSGRIAVDGVPVEQPRPGPGGGRRAARPRPAADPADDARAGVHRLRLRGQRDAGAVNREVRDQVAAVEGPGEREVGQERRAAASPWWARALRYVVRDRPELVLAPLALVLLVYLWDVVTRTGLVAPVLLPSPQAVARALRVLLTAPWFPGNLWTTVLETISGFLIAALLAVAVAVLMDQIRLIRRVGYPYVVVLQVMPSVVLAPIFIVWFGFGISSKIVVAVSTAFFVILVNTLSGLASVPENSRLLMRSMCASRRQMFFKLTLPTALPYVFAAFKTAATLSLIGALVGEFITARSGLGRLLTQFSFALRQDMMFATVLVVGALGIALYGLVAFLEKKVIWWR